MQIVFDFQLTVEARPLDSEHCLFTLRSHPSKVDSATYDASEDAFYVNDIFSYPASEVLYWTKASF